MTLTDISSTLTLPFFGVSGTWKPATKELEAAWELYVELVTRITTVPLQEGSLREALNSLYAIFQETRLILRKYGPEIARPGNGELSVAYIAICVLNYGLRPFLTKWHIILLEHEASKSVDVSVINHEKKWPDDSKMRGELEELRKNLLEYAKALEEVLLIPSIASPK